MQNSKCNCMNVISMEKMNVLCKSIMESTILNKWNLNFLHSNKIYPIAYPIMVGGGDVWCIIQFSYVSDDVEYFYLFFLFLLILKYF